MSQPPPTSESALRDDLRSLCRCADALPLIVWVIDGAGEIVHLNRQWHETVSHDPARSLADNARAAIHPDDHHGVQQQWKQALEAQETFRGEYRLRGKTGHRWFSVVGEPQHDDEGALFAWVAVATDVEARRESEKIRFDSEARYQRLLDTSLEGVLSVGPDDTIRYVNSRFTELVGASSGKDLIGHSLYELIFHEDIPTVQARREARQWDAQQHFELRLRKRDGSACWTWVSAMAETDSTTGEYAGTFSLFTDISKRKEAEAARDALVIRQRKFLREVLFSFSEGCLHLCDDWEELPDKRNPVTPSLPLSRRSVRDLRQAVMQGAEAVQLALERAQDFETAVGEAAMNAVVHAGGGTGQVFQDADRGVVQVWVEDVGSGITEETLHRATLERGFSGPGTLGHGFWMMLKTADRVHLLTGPQGTTIVLEQERQPPLPAWLQKTME